MNDRLFEDYLRNRLANHAEPVDSGGWEALSTDLNRRAKRRALYRGFYYGCVAAAAIVWLIIFLMPSDPQPQNISRSLSIAVITPQINTQLHIAEHIQPIRERSRRAPVISTPVAITADTVKTEIETPPPTPTPPDTLIHHTPSNRPLYNIANFDVEPQPVKTRINAAEGWSIALASSSANGVGQTPFIPVVQRQPSSMRDLFFVRSDSEIPTKYVRESSVHFSPPVSLGVHAQKELFPWMSVGIGLNYTLLQTKSSNPYLNGTYIIRQHLHYVGLPASVMFNFVHLNTVRVYASTGSCIEKAISAYYTSSSGKNERVQVSGLQWSVGVSLGVEHALSKRFGLYVEPGAAYYFDNDQPRSIRTVQPLQFKIELGLRTRI